MIFFTLLLIPILIIMLFTLAFGRNRYTWQESLITFAAAVCIAGLFAGIESCNSKQRDTEYVNGRVISKAREKVSCEHSYECNCITSCSGSGSNQSCSTTCSTCYEHSYDIDWAVYTNIPSRIEIDRINRQGTAMPERWNAVLIGEPATGTHGYTNYVKGAPDSLFYYQDRLALQKYKVLPQYPMNVYDYYRSNKVWDYNGVLPAGAVSAWNDQVQNINADLGPVHEMNLQIFVVKDQEPDYFQALRTAWLGGKKNDILVVFSVNDKLQIQWVDIMAWANSYSFNVSLRDSLQALKTLDQRIFPVIVSEVKANFKRKHMREFQYLENMATPSPTFFFWAVVVEFVICIGLSVFFTINDFTYDNEYF